MATTQNNYTGNGSNKLFSITFPYLDTADIDVFLNGTLQTVTTQYTFANATTIEFVTAPANGATVLLDRSTDDSALAATFFPGSSIKAADLNADFDQTLYVVQEINNKAVKLDDPLYVNKTYIDNADALKVTKAGDSMSGVLAMGTNKITGLGNPTNAQDAATKTYVDAADALKVAKAGDSMTGPLAMGTNKVTGMGNPTDAQDATTKTYVDTADALKVAKAGDTMSGNLAMGGNKVTGLGTPAANTDAATKVYVDTVTLAGNVPDGDRGDITVSGVGTNWTIDNGAVIEAKIGTGAVTETKLGTGSVTSTKILDGTIVNADVNASAGIVATKLAFTQAGTGATARTIDSKLKETVSVKDFGAVGDGVTDDRAAIQAALNASTSVYFPTPSVSYYLLDSVSPQANTTIFGDGASSHIQVIDGTVNCFYLNGVSGVVVRDLKISTKLQTNATAYKCAVLMANECRNCLVENIGVFNWGHWGVAIFNSSNCIVRGCRFSTWFGTVGDSAQIVIFKTSNNNLIEGNYCSAASDHGIFMQDPYTNDTPTGNSIINNYIAAAKGDGISVYVTTAYDTQTLISGNRIYDVQGTFLSGQSGHGIYIQSAGGALITNNTISNCCVSTSSFETQVVAAIGVATGDVTTYPTGTINEVIVSNNHITAQRGPGISVQTCDVPVLVEGNHILSTGTAAVRGEAIYTVNADGVQIKNNTIKHANTNYSVINIQASNKNLKGISVVGNRIRGTTNGIGFNPSGTGTFADTVITGNIITGLSSIALFLNKVSNSQVSNNNLESTGPVFYLVTCSRVRMTANRFYSNYGSYSIIFTGAASSNDGTVADESNDFQGTILHDAGTGGILSRYADSFPGASGFHAVGDRVIQSVPVVGSPKGWRCTVAGNPGTWVSEGNL